jgi:hypothetical protein
LENIHAPRKLVHALRIVVTFPVLDIAGLAQNFAH